MPVDPVLQDALQRGGADRVQVLRLDQELERYVRGPRSAALELPGPLHTKYQRMVAARVAAHYGLDVLGDECDVLRVAKGPCTALPAVRLSAVAVAPGAESVDTAPKKDVKVMRRAGRKGNAGRKESEKESARTSSTVEEKEEEYARARARIFAAADAGPGAPAGAANAAAVAEADPGAAPAVDAVHQGQDGSQAAGSRRGGSARGGRRSGKSKAIMRDRESEARDPDFDRHSVRYAPPQMPMASVWGAPPPPMRGYGPPAYVAAPHDPAIWGAPLPPAPRPQASPAFHDEFGRAGPYPLRFG